MISCLEMLIIHSDFPAIKKIKHYASQHKGTKSFMHFRLLVRDETGRVTRIAARQIQNGTVVIIEDFTYYQEFLVRNTLRTSIDPNQLTGFFDDEHVMLLIIVFRETEQDIGTIQTIAFGNSSERNTFDAIDIQIPFNYERIDGLESILLVLISSIDVHQGFRQIRSGVLIIQCGHDA